MLCIATALLTNLHQQIVVMHQSHIFFILQVKFLNPKSHVRLVLESGRGTLELKLENGELENGIV